MLGPTKGHKRVKNVGVSGFAPGATGALKRMFLAHFLATLDCLDTIYVLKMFGRASNA